MHRAMKRSWLSVGVLVLAAPMSMAAQTAPDGATAPSQEAYMPAQEGMRTKIYGYIDGYWERVMHSPDGVDANGDTEFVDDPHEFDVPNLNLMVQSTVGGRFKAFLNLKAPGAGAVDVRNAWVEVSLWGDRVNARIGKLYRPFGLYNEILDAVPTYIGIEPPELFDGDHLMITRTTNLMLHGRFSMGPHGMSYALTTGNDERARDQVPFGADLRYTFRNMITLGSSFYTSSGYAAPTHGVGDGPPEGGVQTWMARDRYMMYGGYAQLLWGGLILQAEYWEAPHEAERDPEQVLLLLDAGLNPRQLERFGLDQIDPAAPDVSLIKTGANYSVVTYYARAGYAFDTSAGEVIPYAQYDFYKNQETIAAKTFGGDGGQEAGATVDGQFVKLTAGVVYRPVPEAALKLDASNHLLNVQAAGKDAAAGKGTRINNPEVRLSFSYVWSL